MKIPKRIKIAGRDYTVLFPHTFTDSSQVLLGQHDCSGQVIKICGKNTFGEPRHPQGIEQTFWHETLHAIDYLFNCGKIQKLENGEDIIDQMAEGLCQVLRDNKLDFSDRG